MVTDATGECFDYLKDQRIPVIPPGEDGYYAGGMKKKAMHMLYSVMSKTVLGRLMVSDHCENGIREMKYLDELFEKYRKEYPGRQMPTWDEMRKWALPAFENAGDYDPHKTFSGGFA